MYVPFKQYTLAMEERRSAIFLQLRRDYGFTWEELTKLTGMKLRDNVTQTRAQREEYEAACAEGSTI
jgi:hypothetical protein